MREVFDYLLIELLPFWQQFFNLLSLIAWPISILLVARSVRPLISHVLMERGFSFEGFGTQIKIDDRKASQIESSKQPAGPISEKVLNLPRTPTIVEQEELIRTVLEKIDPDEIQETLINALALEQIEKGFLFTYGEIFGSQIVLLQKINERGGSISVADGEEFLREVKAHYPMLSDWDFDQYVRFLIHRGLLETTLEVKLTERGKEFIHFIVRYGLKTDKGL